MGSAAVQVLWAVLPSDLAIARSLAVQCAYSIENDSHTESILRKAPRSGLSCLQRPQRPQRPTSYPEAGATALST